MKKIIVLFVMLLVSLPIVADEKVVVPGMDNCTIIEAIQKYGDGFEMGPPRKSEMEAFVSLRESNNCGMPNNCDDAKSIMCGMFENE